MIIEKRKCAFIHSIDEPGVKDSFVSAYDDNDNLISDMPPPMVEDGYTLEDIVNYNATIVYDETFEDGKLPQGISSATPYSASMYSRRRLQEGYKSIEEQLDMLYWDKKNDTDNWKQHIEEVKSKWPKETGPQHDPDPIS